MLQAAVHLAEHASGFFVHGTGRATGRLLGLDAEPGASSGPERAGNHAASRFLEQWHGDAAAG